jgi:uncharacterized membrane protein
MQQQQLAAVDAGSESERSTLLITYILHALAPFTALTGIAAVIISHIKVNETSNAFIRSHHSWLIRTFWWGLLWAVICSVLFIVLIGALGFVALAIWWLYRTIRGFINYSEKRPMPG